ncbi:MAG TPA: hypothetical protein P5287_04780 [bacterium]|nr:hypothetical protein [bacterium]
MRLSICVSFSVVVLVAASTALLSLAADGPDDNRRSVRLEDLNKGHSDVFTSSSRLKIDDDKRLFNNTAGDTRGKKSEDFNKESADNLEMKFNSRLRSTPPPKHHR